MPKIKFLVSQISNKFFILSIFLPVLFLFVLFFSNFDTTLPSAAFGASPDAVAIRVMPNSSNLSPLRWYQENIKVKGSPQALIVDGYEAVRDGRTVYVNAANIDIQSRLYTNIYIISYNQAAENATVDIFGQILEHWKFNTNIADQAKKDEVVRDTKRLADLADIKLALNNYQASHNGTYPSLAAGSYLSGKSISTWPSWRQTLSTALGLTLPIDPVNKLGACSGYATTTCWNQINKTFADPINNGKFDLPVNSRAYVYIIDSNGAYNICASMESGYNTTLAQGGCPDSMVGYQDSALSPIPIVSCGTAIASPNTIFTSYARLSGPAAARFTNWLILPITPASWVDWANWQWTLPVPPAGLKINNTADGNTKKITAVKTPATGQYSYKITVSNGPLIASSTCDIRINCVPQCPFASDVDIGTTDTRADGCGGRCNVVGTRCTVDPASWASLEPLNTVCVSGWVTQVSNCNTTRQVHGTKCCAVGQPNCRSSAPINSEPATAGDCPVGQSCYQCLAGFIWDAASSRCIKCGDGVINGTEQCDNGAGNTNTPCSPAYGSDCNYCDLSCQNHTVAGERCGDGITNGPVGPPPAEECDDGNLVSGDGCSNLCKSEFCGDGVVTLPEVCDTGLPPRSCTGTMNRPLGADWCPASWPIIDGTQNCSAADNCRSWETACTGTPVSDHTATACNSTSALETDYSCCVLDMCNQDACACCGGGAAATASTTLGIFNNVQSMDVTWDTAYPIPTYYWYCLSGPYNPSFPLPPCSGYPLPPSCQWNGGVYDMSNSSCDECGDKAQYQPVNSINSCRLNKDANYIKNWLVTTNHSTAYYKCWR